MDYTRTHSHFQHLYGVLYPMNMKSTNRNNVKARITTPPCFHNIRFRRTAQARRLGGRYRITGGVDGWAIFNLYKNK